MNSLPAKEGVTAGKLEPADGVNYHKLRFSQATGLVDLAEDYVFYSTAMLFKYGGWRRDPVEDYLREHPKTQIFKMELSLPVFQGLGDDNHRLFVCPKCDWNGNKGLRSFLSSLGGLNRAARSYHCMLVQEVYVPDILMVSRRSTLPVGGLPQVPVTSFGINGNRLRFALKPSAKNKLLTVVRMRPEKAMIRLADAVLENSPRPFQAVEPTPEEALLAQLEQVIKLRSVSGDSTHEG